MTIDGDRLAAEMESASRLRRRGDRILWAILVVAALVASLLVIGEMRAGAAPASSGATRDVAARRVVVPRGVPRVWCHRHPVRCNRVRVFARSQVHRMRIYEADHVRDRTIPRRMQRAVTRRYRVTHRPPCTQCVTPVEARAGCDYACGWFAEWQANADCVRHGYGCYSTTGGPSKPLSTFEKVGLWCTATVVITSLPGAAWLALGNAKNICFWGVVGYLGILWGD